MKIKITLGLSFVLLCVVGLHPTMPAGQGVAALVDPPLDQKVQHFHVKGASMIDAVSVLSSHSIEGLHLGIEQILRNKPSDSEDRSIRFSLHLKNKTVRNILYALCLKDPRYTWSTDGVSIDIYPRSIVGDRSYLLNLEIQQISLTNISDPDRVFLPLHKMFPREEIGYFQLGGDISYAQPWTVSFNPLTVRQLINRVAEHIGPRSSWIFHGSRDDRMFTFQKGAFRRLSKS